MFDDFVLDTVETKAKNTALKFDLSVYGKMRRKDFSFQLLSKGSSLTVMTQQTQPVLSNPKHRIKKSIKNMQWNF